MEEELDTAAGLLDFKGERHSKVCRNKLETNAQKCCLCVAGIGLRIACTHRLPGKPARH
jgi:hypothetical protein